MKNDGKSKEREKMFEMENFYKKIINRSFCKTYKKKCWKNFSLLTEKNST